MSKKKNEKEGEVVVSDSKLDTLLADIEKTFGENTIISGGGLINRDLATIKVSPMLDIGLGGGIPEGSWVMLSGAPL